MSEVEKRGPTELNSLAQQINAEHRAFVGTLQKTVEHGIRAGELLAAAKKQCPYGTWLDWLKGNFEGAARTAQEYMRLYNHRDEVRAKMRDATHFGIGGALKELSEPSRRAIPPEERTIVERAAALPYARSFDPDRLAQLSEESRRGFVSEAAFSGLMDRLAPTAMCLPPLGTSYPRGLQASSPALMLRRAPPPATYALQGCFAR
jgi:hypothetical protein